MTNNLNAPADSAFPGKRAGRLSMISMLAISVGIAASPVHAQDMIEPLGATLAPVPAPDLVAPQPAPASAPTAVSPPVTSPPMTRANTTPQIAPDRADDFAEKGGFDAETVAPEALAQIESEQQARKAAASKATAAKAATTAMATARPAPARATSAPEAGSATQGGPALDGDDSAAFAEVTADAAAATPMIAPVSQPAVSQEAIPVDDATDWGLLAALAALLGIGGAGAYAVGRRRKSHERSAAETSKAEVHGRDPFPAAINEAIMPELRDNPAEPEVHSPATADQPAGRPVTSNAGIKTKVAFADFVADLPEFETPAGKADRSTTIGQRRVTAAPRPYLGEADLSRPEGYFMADVDAMPTPQNPFLTRQNRLKRARALDASLAEMKVSVGNARRKMDQAMVSPRALEPAFS